MRETLQHISNHSIQQEGQVPFSEEAMVTLIGILTAANDRMHALQHGSERGRYESRALVNFARVGERRSYWAAAVSHAFAVLYRG